MLFTGVGVDREWQAGGLAPREWNGGSLHLKALHGAMYLAAAVVGIVSPVVAFDRSKLSGMGRLLRALARRRFHDGGSMAERANSRWRVEVHPSRSGAGGGPARRATPCLRRHSLPVWGPYA